MSMLQTMFVYMSLIFLILGYISLSIYEVLIKPHETNEELQVCQPLILPKV